MKVYEFEKSELIEKFESINVVSFLDFISTSKFFKPGVIVKIYDRTLRCASEQFLIGDCTLYLQPSTSDGGIGYDHEKYKDFDIEFVIDLYTQFTPEINDSLIFGK
jgi:hypothetical protein